MNSFGRREVGRGHVLRRLRLWVVVILVAVVGWLAWVKLEWSRPTASLGRSIDAIGREAEIPLLVRDWGSGLASVDVAIESQGKRYEVLTETYPATSWRGSGLHEKSFTLAISTKDARIPQGEASLVVRASDHSWLNLFLTRPGKLEQRVEIDTVPPTVEVLTSQHYMRLGGSDLVVYRASDDAVRSGVEVDRYFFPGIKGVLPDRSIAVAFFAVPQDVSAQTRPKIVAEDRAGNRREAGFFVSVKQRRFAERTLVVDDDSLQRKVPELIEMNDLRPTDDLVAGYLDINRNLRSRSEERIREVCSRSADQRLWSGVFLRQPNSAPLSSFADRRTYTHAGQVIDTQTHLGYDLASNRLAPVIAVQSGKVVFAENLGIYGDAVIIDHGLGLFSLYGHLSSIAVTVGKEVGAGDAIGRTGESGLAFGDHLHFSVMLWGTHVDPVEWWDPKWIEDHVVGKLKSFEGTRAEARRG